MNQNTQAESLISWSGGKDSCLALWRARQAGMSVRRLVTAMDDTGKGARSHGVSPELLVAQAASLGLEIELYETSWKTYEEKFIAILRKAHAEGIRHAIFGDIDLIPHREWEEKVCAQAGLQPCLPLWDQARDSLVEEFLALGFKAVVVCVNGKYLGREYCGREFDAAFLADLPKGIDACGENGEFHTFVYNGPAFVKPVALQRGQVLSYEAPTDMGGATYYFQQLIPGSLPG